MSVKKEAWYLESEIQDQVLCLLTKHGTGEDPKECKVPSPEKMRAVTKFLQKPLRDLYDSDFFEIQPDEIRIRLRVKDGKVEMVVYALKAGIVNEFVVPFDSAEVAVELCG